MRTPNSHALASKFRRLIQSAPLCLALWYSAALPVRAQQSLPPEPPPELALPYSPRVQDPTRDRVFHVESEEELLHRLRKENPNLAKRIYFPKTATPAEPFTTRTWTPQTTLVEPNFVCYRPLYFEDKNSERYGWSFCLIQPFVSTGKFYLDFLTLPLRMGLQLPCRRECNTGYPLPGDPVPYRIYVPTPTLDHR